MKYLGLVLMLGSAQAQILCSGATTCFIPGGGMLQCSGSEVGSVCFYNHANGYVTNGVVPTILQIVAEHKAESRLRDAIDLDIKYSITASDLATTFKAMKEYANLATDVDSQYQKLAEQTKAEAIELSSNGSGNLKRLHEASLARACSVHQLVVSLSRQLGPSRSILPLTVRTPFEAAEQDSQLLVKVCSTKQALAAMSKFNVPLP